MVLLGASGSGKTTFVNRVGSVEAPSLRTVEADGRDVAGMSDDEQTVHRLCQVLASNSGQDHINQQ